MGVLTAKLLAFGPSGVELEPPIVDKRPAQLLAAKQLAAKGAREGQATLDHEDPVDVDSEE